MDPNLIWLNLNEDPPRKPFVLVYVFVLGASSIAGGVRYQGEGTIYYNQRTCGPRAHWGFRSVKKHPKYSKIKCVAASVMKYLQV